MLLLNIREQIYLQELRKVKERVFFIYSKSQEAIDFDAKLITYYEQLFGKVELTDSITRAGRWWRSSDRDIKKEKRFLRSDTEEYLAKEREELNKYFWSNT